MIGLLIVAAYLVIGLAWAALVATAAAGLAGAGIGVPLTWRQFAVLVVAWWRR